MIRYQHFTYFHLSQTKHAYTPSITSSPTSDCRCKPHLGCQPAAALTSKPEKTHLSWKDILEYWLEMVLGRRSAQCSRVAGDRALEPCHRARLVSDPPSRPHCLLELEMCVERTCTLESEKPGFKSWLSLGKVTNPTCAFISLSVK